MTVEMSFDVVLRGYDRAEVDAAVRSLAAALESRDPEVRSSAARDVVNKNFRRALRGYDSQQVDAYLRATASKLVSPTE